MSAPHTVVVVGASYGGLPVAHALLKDVLPASGKEYKLVLINPSEEFYWKVGAPRAITRPEMLPMDKALLNFLPTFQKYGDKFQFIKGKVTAIEPDSRNVDVNTGDKIHYDQLVIASGTYFDNDLWSTSRGTDALRQEVQDLHKRLPSAQSILIGGGGPCGVETAGELGEAYGGKKEIILLSGGSRLLNRTHNQAPSKLSQQMLEKMGVTVTHNVLVKSTTKEGDKNIVTLSNGETKTVDVYIGAAGDKPNTSFVPKDWLNERGQVKTDANTLRVDVPGVTGVYCVGSVASYSDGSILDTKLAYTAAVESVKLDLNGESEWDANPVPRASANKNPRCRPENEEGLQEDPVRDAVRPGRLAAGCWSCFRLEAAQLHDQDGQGEGLHDRQRAQAYRRSSMKKSCLNQHVPRKFAISRDTLHFFWSSSERRRYGKGRWTARCTCHILHERQYIERNNISDLVVYSTEAKSFLNLFVSPSISLAPVLSDPAQPGSWRLRDGNDRHSIRNSK